MGYVSSGSAQTAGSSVFVDTFVAGVDYTAGTSSQVTLSNTPASANSVWVFFNGIAQHHSEYTVNGNVVSFTSVIPTNVSQIQVQVNTQLAVGVPGEATVGYSTLTSAAKTTLQRKNAIINGNFNIWQRGTSQTAAGYGSADRWSSYFSGTSVTLSVSRQAFTIGQTVVPNEPEYFARHTFVSGSDTNTAALQRQFIEDVRTFAGQTITVSFYATCSTSLDLTVELAQVFGTGGSPSTTVYTLGQKVSLTPSWAKYEVTINVPSISGKTLGSNDDDYLQVNFWFSAGSDFNSRSDTLGLQSGTIDIAQVQVEKGSSATNYERRSVGEELALCQRYYCKSYDMDVDPGTVTTAGACPGRPSVSGVQSVAEMDMRFPVTMRDTPTVTWYSTEGSTTARIRDVTQASDLTVTATNYQGANSTGAPTANVTAISDYLLGHFTADAEL